MRPQSRPLLRVLSILHLIYLTNTVARGGLLPPKDHHLKKRCLPLPNCVTEIMGYFFEKAQGVSDQLSVVSQETAQQRWNAELVKERASSPLVERSYWEHRTFQVCQNAALNELLKESARSRIDQATIIALLSKKLIHPIEQNHRPDRLPVSYPPGLREPPSEASSPRNKDNVWDKNLEENHEIIHPESPASDPLPLGFAAVHENIKSMKSECENLSAFNLETSQWSSIILRLMVVTLAHKVFESAQWKVGREIIFEELISLAYLERTSIYREIVTGEQAAQDLLKEEDWWSKVKGGMSDNLSQIIGPETERSDSQDEWWMALKEKLSHKESIA
ncbi:uncharacterized protein PGTG_10922 [Puccinia graminis f. sp. tritici CRL 75-36-700-3]|uniref:Uncharacterized protein n=1 Tax=Puccinia graminis f. sp. tritici (strain CRL 75-36-700-3 / race SCCL) TaxID=418459 RepID=E3KKD8_PUCGT|nr:uncharacterized protein PGTG_10922 [Puccinia graminis f. sp. tritici CRL 75-36-700-3]EFP84763.1 hypothetical protein PGTG_10922 [Puccinia graminis f. sp. tritici CRL 75-36-700-3]